VDYQDSANLGKVILITGSTGFRLLMAGSLARGGYIALATMPKSRPMTDYLNYSLGAKSMKRFALSLLTTAIAMATLSPMAVATTNFGQVRQDNLDKNAVDFDQIRRESLKESTKLDDLRQDNRDKDAINTDEVRRENLEKSDRFDQLRRENLDKDAVDFDTLRQENLEKSDRFDQLRRENLDKDAVDFDQIRRENLDLDAV
jgi:hypothetical protein